MPPTDAATDRFIHGENLIHLRKRLAQATNAATRQQILNLLAEQDANGRLPPPKKD